MYYFVGKKPVFKKPVLAKKRLIDRQKMELYYQQLKPQMEERLQLLETEISDMACPCRLKRTSLKRIVPGVNLPPAP